MQNALNVCVCVHTDTQKQSESERGLSMLQHYQPALRNPNQTQQHSTLILDLFSTFLDRLCSAGRGQPPSQGKVAGSYFRGTLHFASVSVSLTQLMGKHKTDMKRHKILQLGCSHSFRLWVLQCTLHFFSGIHLP